ncbi:MAG: CHAT domain-containing protein, partial [Burkholderiales bacterium]
SAHEDRYRVRVIASPQGSDQPDDQADAVTVPEGLGSLVRALNERNAAQSDDFEGLCRRLGDLLLPSRARDLLKLNLDWLTRKEGRALRIRIRCESDALSQVPWEFSYVPFGLAADKKGGFPKSGFLIANPSLCVVRHEEGAAVNIPPLGDRGAEVLFTSAQPDRTRAISSKNDLQSLRAALKQVARQPVVHPVERVSAKVLQETLMGRNVDIFHFSGHADLSDGRGYLAFEDADRKLERCFGEELAVLLTSKGVRLATLFACETAAIEGPSPWSGVARSLVSVGIPAVVGMQYRVLDRSAARFVETFYTALAKSLHIEDAITEGRRALLLNDDLIRDVGVPVLYLRGGEDFDTALLRATPDAKTRPAAGIRAQLAAGLGVAVDYKDIHDKLHDAKYGPYNELVRATDPGTSTKPNRHALERLAAKLILLRESIGEIQGRGNCDARHVDPLMNELNEANEPLGIWPDDGNAMRELVDTAIELFGHILDVYLSQIDTVLHERINDLPSVDSIRMDESMSIIERDELAAVREEIQAFARRHKACQDLESLLNRICPSDTVDAQRVLRSWKVVSDNLALVVNGWNDAEAAKLTKASNSLSKELSAEQTSADTGKMQEAFESFSTALGTGYYKVDVRLKGACSRSLPRLRQAAGTTTDHLP